MKLKLWDRLLLALYALLGLAALAVAAGMIAAPGLIAPFVDKLRSAWSMTLFKVIICAAAVLLLAWTVRVFLLAFKHEPKYDKGSVAVQNTENGSVRVSVAAMDALVRQAIGSAEGVKDIKSKIVNHEDSISVRIEMTLSGDAHIPNVTMLLQRNIKSFIEEFSGIAVRDVSVMVSSIVPVEGPVAIAEKAGPSQKAPIVVEPEVSRAEPAAEAPESAREADRPAADVEETAPSYESAAEDDTASVPEDATGDAAEQEEM